MDVNLSVAVQQDLLFSLSTLSFIMDSAEDIELLIFNKKFFLFFISI